MNEPRQTQAFQAPVKTQTVVLDDESIVDIRSAANFLGYVGRSTKRRRKLLWMTAGMTFALVLALAVVMPRAYRIETRILTHKSSVMSALVHPGSSIPPSADNPTGGAVELIKSRNNLTQLLQDTHLKDLWAEQRSPISKFKDSIMEKLLGKPKADDVDESFLKLLDEKVSASVEGDVVLINVEWPNAVVAKTLADSVHDSFLAMRRKMELSEIEETVNILSRNVEMSRVGIGDVIKRMQKIVEQRESDLEGHVSQNASRSEPRRRSRKSKFIAIRKPTAVDSVMGSDLQRELSEKNAALLKAKRSYEERLSRARDDLSSLLANLGPDHPDVINAKRNLEAIGREQPALGALEAEQANLAGQVKQMPVLPQDDAPKPEAQKQSDDYDVMRVPVSEDLYKEMDKDPEIAAVLGDLKKRQDAHDEMVSRLVNAKLQSETAGVAFEFRYITTEPPVMPRKSIKPNVPVMVGGGAVGSLVLGMLLALLADLLSGRVLESWQVGRFLGVKVLGELEEP